MLSYVVNLKSDMQRMDRIAAMFKQRGIAHTRFNAIDRLAVAEHPMFARLPKQAALPPSGTRDWSLGELGCLLSHISIWQMVANGNDQHVAVFEDDIHISADLSRFLGEAFPLDADLIKVESTGAPLLIDRRPAFSVGSTKLFRMRSGHSGSGGYIISQAAARKLLARVSAFDRPVDHILFDHDHVASRDLVRFQCVPALVAQDVTMPTSSREGGSLKSGMTDRVIPPPPKGRSRLRDLPMRAVRKAWRVLTQRLVQVPFRSADGRLLEL